MQNTLCLRNKKAPKGTTTNLSGQINTYTQHVRKTTDANVGRYLFPASVFLIYT